jgi:hypothetical protein
LAEFCQQHDEMTRSDRIGIWSTNASLLKLELALKNLGIVEIMKLPNRVLLVELQPEKPMMPSNRIVEGFMILKVV